MRTTRAFIVLLILTSFQLLHTAEANEGVSLLVKAYQNSGFNPTLIRSGVAEFEVTRDRGETMPQSQVMEKMQREDERMIREQYKGDETKIALELKRIRDSREESKRRIVQEKMKILMSGNDRTHGGEPGEQYKRLYERHEYIPSLNQWVHASIDLTFGAPVLDPNTIRSKLQIHWVPNNRDLVIKGETIAFAEFQEFGRFQEAVVSYVSAIIQLKIDRKTFALPADFLEFFESKIQSLELNVNVAGEVDYDGGAKAKIVEVKKGDKLLEKYHIDVDRGYLCPYQYVMEESGSYFTVITAEEYIVEKKTGLYYPTSSRSVVDFTKTGIGGKADVEYRLVPETLRFNQAVSDKEFAIDIPEGARVADFRDKDNHVRYVAVKNGTISLAKGGYDLPKLSWLVREEDLKDYVPPKGGLSGFGRWLFVGVGLLILCVVLIQWKKHRNKSSAATFLILFFLPFTLLAAGCNKSNVPAENSISAMPSVIDFGKVRSTDSPVKIAFDISNDSNKAIIITDIDSGCGCAVIDIPQDPIPPGGKVTVVAHVNVFGRSGAFENKLTVKTASEQTLTIPIHGNVETDIWTSGQALRCTVAPNEKQASTTLTLFTVKYPEIVFADVQQDKGVSLEEISRSTKDGETVIRFGVDVEVGDSDTVTRNISIVPQDDSIAPLTIPFFCFRDHDSSFETVFVGM